GLSGSGKTTRALQLAPEIGRAPGAVAVRSDVERKRLAGSALEERMPAGSYTPEASARVYETMMARAGRILRAGHSVVLDAVFARPEERQAAEALAAKVGVPFEGLWLDVPKEVAQARVAARKADASDATPDVVNRQFGYELGEIRWKRQ
ncbi:MAG TPA: AAA family ATPase, partial [Reyranella sp.]|nr:AAA family ATPase [Reyranella sp.]